MDWVEEVLHFSQTDVGVKRSHNQDALGVAIAPNLKSFRSKGHLFVVADGMGSHAVGELASKLAVDTVLHSYSKLSNLEPRVALKRAVIEANHVIHEKGRLNEEFKGMGTTATALLLLPDGAHVGHVGDSRCYRIRGNEITQLSFDHSLLWEMARRRKVTPEQVPDVPSNIIIRSLGPESKVQVDVNGPYDVEEGDRFVLCSDGLSGPVHDNEIWAAVSHLPGDEACRFLIELANIRGGLDNITLIVVQVGDSAKKRSSVAKSSILRSGRAYIMERLSRVPGPWWTVAAGFGMLGVLALGHALFDWHSTGSLLSSGAVVVAGLVWFLLRRQGERESAAAPPPIPPTYRKQTCSISPGMIENLVRMERSMAELAAEEHWEIEWDGFNAEREKAKVHLETGTPADAFVAYCRVVACLASSLRRRRAKGEKFNPIWDKRKT